MRIDAHGWIAAGCMMGLLSSSGIGTASAAEARQSPFGTLADGQAIESVELSNGVGVTARIMTLGATLQSLSVPDRNGKSADIVLGYAEPQKYLDKPQYFGASVGRFANRIAKGEFEINGQTYHLAINDHGQSLHGGLRGFDKVVWHLEAVKSGPTASATFSYTSPDGEEGFPGTLHVEAIYTLDAHNQLGVKYRATTDAPTIVNLTNHSYFNLAGEAAGRSAMDQLVQIHAAQYTPVDQHLIPTGELRAVANTPFDFRALSVVGSRIRDGRDPQIMFGRGYDHNFVLDGPQGQLNSAVHVVDPYSGRVMEILTTAPGVQFYTSNFLDGTVTGKGGVAYRQGDAIAFEPQVFPDAPNHANFPSPRLDPGNTYENAIVYRFSVSKR